MPFGDIFGISLRHTREPKSPNCIFFFCARRQIRAAALEHTMVAKPLARIDAAGGAITKLNEFVPSMGHWQHPA